MICKHWMCLLIFLGFDATCAMFSQCSPVSRQLQTNWCYWCSYPYIHYMNAKLATSGSHLIISSNNEHTQNSGSQKYAENDKGFSLEVFSNMSNKNTSRIPAPSSAYFLHLHPFRTFRANKSHEAITQRWDLLKKTNTVIQTLSKNKSKIKVSRASQNGDPNVDVFGVFGKMSQHLTFVACLARPWARSELGLFPRPKSKSSFYTDFCIMTLNWWQLPWMAKISPEWFGDVFCFPDTLQWQPCNGKGQTYLQFLSSGGTKMHGDNMAHNWHNVVYLLYMSKEGEKEKHYLD